MLEEKGTVIDIKDGVIWVQTEIKTTCGTCKAKDNCGTSTIAKAFSPKPNVISVKSDLEVKVGDTVIIGIEENFVVKSAFYVYIFPIVGFILFAFIAEYIFTWQNPWAELLSTISAFFGGWLGFLFARKQLNQMGCEQNSNIQLLKVESHEIPIVIK